MKRTRDLSLPYAILLTLVGLGVSSALVADHVFEVGTFCSANDPCAEVAASPYGEVLGVPLAVVGVVGFAVLLAVSLVPTRWASWSVSPATFQSTRSR